MSKDKVNFLLQIQILHFKYVWNLPSLSLPQFFLIQNELRTMCWTPRPQSIDLWLTYHSWQSRATNHSTKSQRSRGWLKPGFPLPACRRRGTWPRCRRSYVVPSYPREDTFSVPSGLGTSASSVRSLCRTWLSTPTTRSTPWSGTCRRARSPRELQNKIPNL